MSLLVDSLLAEGYRGGDFQDVRVSEIVSSQVSVGSGPVRSGQVRCCCLGCSGGG